ncbi:hypothetical protein D3H55_20540 [Bacillus salacetis]|uniref:DUF4367 domain-containing protein n=1 Tax=Bacillus salacetis TaxID=2315464 RepID=A0A3A1QR36_9BACI|nr:hypothetical protein [Bacillus salacetis]RIW28956.1 hypothetical protein D3H55_20540 [Bacillus salacetis]
MLSIEKIILPILIAGFLSGCSQSDSYGELTDYIEETRVEDTFKELRDAKEMPISDALKELAFEPKQINVAKLPFKVEEKTVRVTQTKDNSQMIEFNYTGPEHELVFIAENSVEFKEDSSIKYEEIHIDKGRIALFGEGGQSQDVTWIEGDKSYLLRINYLETEGVTPEKLSKEEVTKMVDELQEP